MKQLLIGNLLLLFLYFPFSSTGQTAIGIEAGFNFAGNSPSPDKVFFLRSLHPGLRAGLFVEKDLRKKIALRTGVFYAIRFFLYGKSDPGFASAYRALHCITLPVLISFRASSKLSFNIGMEVITIVDANLPYFNAPAVHLGPIAAIAYQINPTFAIRLHGVYDLIRIRQDNAPNSANYNTYNSISLGLSLAYTFKRIKKRRVIRSPG